jgi:hypothetical protein
LKPSADQPKARRQLLLWPEGIFVSDFEKGEIGPDLFHQVCKFGSKHRDSAWLAGLRHAKEYLGEIASHREYFET